MNSSQAMQMAIICANQNEFAQAEKILKDILISDNKFHPALHMMGQLAFQKGNDEIAKQYFLRAVSLNGDIAQYHRDLAEAFFYLGKLKEALATINRSVQLNPNDAKAHFIAGNILMNAGAHEPAIKAFEQTIKLYPDHEFAHNNLGSLYEEKNFIAKAKHEYETAVKINPGNVIAQNNLATLLVAESEIEAAKVILNNLIKIKPDYIEAHYNLSALKQYKPDDPHIGILKSLFENIDNIPIDNKIKLHFCLGKVYSDLKDYENAFQHYQSGNKLNRSTYDYSKEEVKKTAEKIKTVFSKNYFEQNEKPKTSDVIPIFVVGMPRSGTSLVEQILASHSKIDAGGELLFLNELIHQNFNKFPDDLEKKSYDELEKIGHDYINKVKSFYPDTKYIVDKMPGNFQYAGLITKIFAKAFIVNTVRNPLDCCLSNFTQLFRHTIPYTSDLAELGHYFNIYADLMAHWQTVLPKGILYNISYEDIISNLEKEARKLIGFIGLNWESECLTFYKNKNIVRTASAAQVRKPVYGSSIEKWRVYEKHLPPLFNALDKKYI
ncbi:MAG: sulfotransferase [Kordiimonadaceae bacterium]|nr:sulfotransferase [Kordiimonadaceae bacterium]